MYGKNVVTKSFPAEDGSLKVHSIWPTIQGEGPDAGRPAVFIRLSHCNLKCYFCDTEFDSGEVRSLDYFVNTVLRVSQSSPSRLAVITGGEPFLQNVLPLVEALNQYKFEVSVETAGTVYLPGSERLFAADRSINGNLIVCSPKTPKLSPNLIPLIGALKYIVRSGEFAIDDGLPLYSTQRQGELARIYRPCTNLHKDVEVYIQPMDELDTRKKEQSARAAADICMKHGYRLSLQMHKMVGLD